MQEMLKYGPDILAQETARTLNEIAKFSKKFPIFEM